MRKKLINTGLLAVFAGVFSVAHQASAATGTVSKTPVLLELFTSEGCSSCPPAERLLQTLDDTQPFPGVDLIVLSEHVDYWNNGAWVDPYSSKLFSARQVSYGDHFGLDSVYTPQLIVDGQHEMVGSNAVEIRKAIRSDIGDKKVALTLSNIIRNGNRIKVHLKSAELPNAEGSAIVYLALAQNKVHSHVAGGENAGRSLTHVAVVRTLATLGRVKGGSSFTKDVTIPLPSGSASSGFRVVAFLQDNKSRNVLGATFEKVPN